MGVRPAQIAHGPDIDKTGFEFFIFGRGNAADQQYTQANS